MEILGVSKTAVQHLRNLIISGQLAPGQRLNEVDLSSRLGISRPPLREAYRYLENENLVIRIPRRGCYVTDVSMEDCLQIFEAREMIECYAVDILKENNIRDLPDVESELKVSSSFALSVSGTNEPISITQNPFPSFHTKLIERTGNHWIIRFHKSISSSLARYQFMCTDEPRLAVEAQQQHEQILDLVENGNYDQAKELLRSHINFFYDVIEKVMTKKQRCAQ
jgi:DNA-binding GntR family transcriptional regulator